MKKLYMSDEEIQWVVNQLESNILRTREDMQKPYFGRVKEMCEESLAKEERLVLYLKAQL